MKTKQSLSSATKNYQNYKKLRLRLVLEKFFIYELWQHILLCTIIVFGAWLFDKPIEAVMFVVAHCVIRCSCDKQFHCDSTACCMLLSGAIIFFGIMAILPTEVSLLCSIPISILITYVGSLAVKEKPNIYAMDKAELYAHCRSRGLDDVECKIAYYLIIERLKGKELYEATGYSERQIVRKRKHIFQKIK